MMRAMHPPREHRYSDASALARALCEHIEIELQTALAARGRASLVVSGGRTPTPLFNRLAQQNLPWQDIAITLADERWVATDTDTSNERLLRHELLRDHAARAPFFGLKSDAETAALGAQRAWSALAQIPRPFDVVVLGMGDDGHTASLFPASPQLAQALDALRAPACVAMQAPVAPHERLSLNLAALLDARQVILHIQGAHKWAVYQAAKAAGLATDLPIRAVLQQTKLPVEVFWAP